MTQRGRVYDLTWRRQDHAALVSLSVLATVALGIAAAADRTWFQESLATDDARLARITEKIDPNTATYGSLRRLPGIGEVRAKAIIHYRTAGRHAFHRAQDLCAVPGIGPATAVGISSYLTFPGDSTPGLHEGP